jgi:hypothetical protein
MTMNWDIIFISSLFGIGFDWIIFTSLSQTYASLKTIHDTPKYLPISKSKMFLIISISLLFMIIGNAFELTEMLGKSAFFVFLLLFVKLLHTNHKIILARSPA